MRKIFLVKNQGKSFGKKKLMLHDLLHVQIFYYRKIKQCHIMKKIRIIYGKYNVQCNFLIYALTQTGDNHKETILLFALCLSASSFISLCVSVSF